MEFFEVKINQYCHPVVREAWKNTNETFSVLKNADPEKSLEMLRNRVHSEICDLILKSQANKVLSHIYTNSSGVSTLVVGYDVKHPDTWHIMVKLKPIQN